MSDAQIFDRGYRRYDGPRTGLPGAIRSLVIHSMRQALGLNRSAKFKVIPVLIIVSSYLPAIVFVGVTALFSGAIDASDLPSYAGYYGYVVAALYLFAGFIAPQLLCNDRRTGMLGVYLASPLNRGAYLVGKALAVLALLLIVTLGPPLLMLIAFSLQNVGPDGFVEWIEIFSKVVLSSLVIGVLYAAVGMAIAATTDRWIVATATILAAMPGSAIVTDLLADPNAGDISPHLRLLNIPNLPRDLIFRIYGERPLWSVLENPTWSLWAAWAFWVGVSVAFVWWQYRRLLVRR